MTKTDKTNSPIDYVGSFKDFCKKIKEVFEHISYIIPLLGGIYQATFLISIGCLRYFSWSQAISDSIVVCCYLLMIFFGVFVRRQIFSNIPIILHYIFDFILLALIVLMHVVFYYFGSEILLCILLITTGIFIGPVSFSDLNQYIFQQGGKVLRVQINMTYILLVILLPLLMVITQGSFRYDSFNLNEVKYKVEYKNDTYVFGRGQLESGEDEDAISIFRTDKVEDKIVSRKPSIRLHLVVNLLKSLDWPPYWALFIMLGIPSIIFSAYNNKYKKV